MAEYIERETAKAKIREKFKFVPARIEINEVLNSIPAADVRPVVRGKWRFEIGDGKTCVDGWVCSACNCGFHTNVPYFEGFNFCPNCGADMREKSCVDCNMPMEWCNKWIGVENGKRSEDCPLVPVPPHGDLIDRDKLMQEMRLFIKENMLSRDDARELLETIDAVPTIIPAEEGDT